MSFTVEDSIGELALRFYEKYLPLLNRLAERRFNHNYEEIGDFLHDAYEIIHQAILEYRKNRPKGQAIGAARWKRKNKKDNNMALETYIQQSLRKLFVRKIAAAVVLKKSDNGHKILLSPSEFQKKRAYYMSMGYEVELITYETPLEVSNDDGSTLNKECYRYDLDDEIKMLRS